MPASNPEEWKLVPLENFEISTYRIWAGCSSFELQWHVNKPQLVVYFRLVPYGFLPPVLRKWYAMTGLNRRPSPCKGAATTAELIARYEICLHLDGACRRRFDLFEFGLVLFLEQYVSVCEWQLGHNRRTFESLSLSLSPSMWSNWRTSFDPFHSSAHGHKEHLGFSDSTYRLRATVPTIESSKILFSKEDFLNLNEQSVEQNLPLWVSLLQWAHWTVRLVLPVLWYRWLNAILLKDGGPDENRTRHRCIASASRPRGTCEPIYVWKWLRTGCSNPTEIHLMRVATNHLVLSAIENWRSVRELNPCIPLDRRL